MLSVQGKIPDSTVSKISDDGYEDVQMVDLFKEGLNILVGVPGAFTPICTEQHLPSLIESAEELKAIGINEIYCISDDHRWAIDSWRKTLLGSEKIVFLSDGNSDFLKEIKMENTERELYLEGRYSRFYALVHDGRIRRMRAEQTVLKTVSTSGECILTDTQDVMKALEQ